MSLLFKTINHKFYYPPDASAGSGGSLDVDEMIDFMNDDSEVNDKSDKSGDEDEPKPKKAKSEPEDKTDKKTKGHEGAVEEDEDELEDNKEDDEDDDLAALEEELEEPAEDKLEELVSRPSRREILKKHPKIFEDFPGLEKAYYREQQFTELFPTIDDAKQAKEGSEILSRFESDLSSGNLTTTLQSVKQANPKAFAKIADNYIEALGRVDNDAFLHVTSNLLRSVIIKMTNEGVRRKSDVIKNAAAIVNQYFFGTDEISAPEKLTKEDDDREDPKETEIKERERKFLTKQYQTALTDMNTKANRKISSLIADGIDPKKTMTEYVRKTASRDAFETLDKLIQKDTRFKGLVDKLWERAFQNDLSEESVNKILSAYISRAQTLLPSVIKKARNEALKGMGKRVRNDDVDDNDDVSEDKPRNRDNGSPRPKKSAKTIPEGMSTLDYLMAD